MTEDDEKDDADPFRNPSSQIPNFCDPKWWADEKWLNANTLKKKRADLKVVPIPYNPADEFGNLTLAYNAASIFRTQAIASNILEMDRDAQLNKDLYSPPAIDLVSTPDSVSPTLEILSDELSAPEENNLSLQCEEKLPMTPFLKTVHSAMESHAGQYIHPGELEGVEAFDTQPKKIELDQVLERINKGFFTSANKRVPWRCHHEWRYMFQKIDNSEESIGWREYEPIHNCGTCRAFWIGMAMFMEWLHIRSHPKNYLTNNKISRRLLPPGQWELGAIMCTEYSSSALYDYWNVSIAVTKKNYSNCVHPGNYIAFEIDRGTPGEVVENRKSVGKLRQMWFLLKSALGLQNKYTKISIRGQRKLPDTTVIESEFWPGDEEFEVWNGHARGNANTDGLIHEIMKKMEFYTVLEGDYHYWKNEIPIYRYKIIITPPTLVPQICAHNVITNMIHTDLMVQEKVVVGYQAENRLTFHFYPYAMHCAVKVAEGYSSGGQTILFSRDRKDGKCYAPNIYKEMGYPN